MRPRTEAEPPITSGWSAEHGHTSLRQAQHVQTHQHVLRQERYTGERWSTGIPDVLPFAVRTPHRALARVWTRDRDRFPKDAMSASLRSLCDDSLLNAPYSS